MASQAAVGVLVSDLAAVWFASLFLFCFGGVHEGKERLLSLSTSFLRTELASKRANVWTSGE
jgi:hypothetical protein